MSGERRLSLGSMVGRPGLEPCKKEVANGRVSEPKDAETADSAGSEVATVVDLTRPLEPNEELAALRAEVERLRRELGRS